MTTTTFSCTVCNIDFNTQDDLSGHMVKYHAQVTEVREPGEDK